MNRSIWTHPQDPSDLESCHPEGMAGTNLLLANYRVLDGRKIADSIEVPVEITSVGAVTADPKTADADLVTQRLRIDTVHFLMTKDSTSKKWGVCGYPAEGVGFDIVVSRLGKVRWVPPGASIESLRSLTDSLILASEHGS